MSDAVRIHVREILHARGAGREVEDARIREIEAAGGRIVDGGQLDNQTWEITDGRTGTRLAHGANGLDGFSEAWLRRDQDGWWSFSPTAVVVTMAFALPWERRARPERSPEPGPLPAVIPR